MKLDRHLGAVVNLYDLPPAIQVTAEDGLRITLNRPDEQPQVPLVRRLRRIVLLR